MKDWYKKAQHLQNVERVDLDERALTRAIRDAIIAEEDAIKQYETVVDSTDNETAKKILQSIANEERVHIGELIELLSMLFDDEDKFLEEGRDEVKESKSNKKIKESQDMSGINCPKCGKKGDMLNASMPTVYDCTFCDIMWNPDNLPEFSKASRGSRPSLHEIFMGQSKMWSAEQAKTTLEDFIYKAHQVGYDKDKIVEGLEVFYRQHPSSGSGIYDRAMAKFSEEVI